MSRSVADSKAVASAKLYLEMRRYYIREQNWSRSRQRIDIVAEKDDIIYLVDVNYQSDSSQSDNHIQVLSATKIQQRQLATESWVHENKWTGKYMLASIEIGDPNFTVISFADTLP